jgi:hypothetical protein
MAEEMVQQNPEMQRRADERLERQERLQDEERRVSEERFTTLIATLRPPVREPAPLV